MAAITDLTPFVGTWDMEAVFPKEWDVPPPDGETTSTFEWLVGGAFLLQRDEAPDPIPQGHIVYAVDEERGGFVQHYFDSRGVARLYAMTFDGTTWTLERTTADFSPLDFSQRYTGTFSSDRNEIRGAWEICHDGVTWERDFELSYRRRT